MSGNYAAIKYTAGTPGADSNNYVLWSSVAHGVAVHNQNGDQRRYLLTLLNSAAGTLVGQVSDNGGTSWTTFYTEAIVANTAFISRAIRFDGARDVQFYWTNGGSAQATWLVMQAVDDGGHLEVERNWRNVNSIALASNQVFKATPGKLKSFSGQIAAAAASATYYLQLWNLAAAPADATAITDANSLMTWEIVHTTATPSSFSFDLEGAEFSVGCVLGVSSTQFTKTASGNVMSAVAAVE